MKRNLNEKSLVLAFTLLELLVVISIVMILASILLPALKKTKETSSRILCASNMKQISLGSAMYADDKSGWLPLGGTTGEWRNDVYNYVGGREDLSALTDLQKLSYILSRNKLFFCPSLPGSIKSMSGFITGIGWNYKYMGYKEFDTIYPSPRIMVSRIPRPAETIMFGDTSDDYSVWFRNVHLYTPGDLGWIIIPRHYGRINMACADGHIDSNNTSFFCSNPDLYKVIK